MHHACRTMLTTFALDPIAWPDSQTMACTRDCSRAFSKRDLECVVPRWYRARVQKREGLKFHVYYIDYGDTSLVGRKRIRPIKPEWLEV